MADPIILDGMTLSNNEHFEQAFPDADTNIRIDGNLAARGDGSSITLQLTGSGSDNRLHIAGHLLGAGSEHAATPAEVRPNLIDMSQTSAELLIDQGMYAYANGINQVHLGDSAQMSLARIFTRFDSHMPGQKWPGGNMISGGGDHMASIHVKDSLQAWGTAKDKAAINSIDLAYSNGNQLAVDGMVYALKGGMNSFRGSGNENFFAFSRGITAEEGGVNEIILSGAGRGIEIHGGLRTRNGSNTLHMTSGQHQIEITEGIQSRGTAGGNKLILEGQSALVNISGHIESAGITAPNSIILNTEEASTLRVNGGIVSREQTYTSIEMLSQRSVSLAISKGLDAYDSSSTGIFFAGTTADIRFGAVKATKSTNAGTSSTGAVNFIQGEGAERIEFTVTDTVSALYDGRNTIDLQAANIVLNTGRITAAESGYNELYLRADNTLNFSTGFLAYKQGRNHIVANGSSQEHEAHIQIGGNMAVSDSGSINTFVASDVLNAHLSLTGELSSSYYGENYITLDALAETSLTVGQLYANHYSSNIVHVSGEAAMLTVDNGFSATWEAINDITLEASTSTMQLSGRLSAINAGALNRVSATGYEHNSLRIMDGLFASNEANNQVTAYSEGSNFVHIEAAANGTALAAIRGSNAIIIEGGAVAQVIIEGDIITSDPARGSNSLTGIGENNLFISLDGTVSVGAFSINAGEGYDVLQLTADSQSALSARYSGWLVDLNASEAGADLSIEAIRLYMGDVPAELSQLGWLNELIDSRETLHGERIALELNIDNAREPISLDALFTDTTMRNVSGLDMSGSNGNVLNIFGGLGDNGLAGNTLRILGDEQDRVVLSDDWSRAHSDVTDQTGLAYNVYQNALDELFIQNSITIV